MPTINEVIFEHRLGKREYTQDDHRPDKHGVQWIRHDRVIYQGRELQGAIIVERVFNDGWYTRYTTVCNGKMVDGRSGYWLLRNQTQSAAA